MTYNAGLGLEEKLTSLFQPDILLSAQYFETLRSKTRLEPEKKLMLAVLEHAVACFQKYIFARDRRGKSPFHEAEGWILGKDADRLFSFENVCEVLELNPAYLRWGLLSWKESKLAKQPRIRILPFAQGSRERERGKGKYCSVR